MGACGLLLNGGAPRRSAILQKHFARKRAQLGVTDLELDPSRLSTEVSRNLLLYTTRLTHSNDPERGAQVAASM